MIHEVEIACPASLIPEKLAVNINHLALSQSILLNSLEVPQGAKILAADLEAVLVECVVPLELPEEGRGRGGGGRARSHWSEGKEEEGEEEQPEPHGARAGLA